MPGHDIPWQEWVLQNFPHTASAPMVERHIELHQWFDDLERGVKPPPEVQPWARGSGKTTTGQLGIARVCAKLTRRFVLYVSLTQGQADQQMENIQTLLNVLGVEPRINKTGKARAWRRDQLQTKHGFNVAGFGMESALRGLRVDDFRPDLIWFDDIDSHKDSYEQILKKIQAITLMILPMGSADCAVLFTGNLVHTGSIMKRLVDGRARFLLNRKIKPAVPAVFDLEVETVEGENGLDQYKIVGGTPSWPGGQPLHICEMQMNEWGYDAFMREAQHDTRIGGTYFEQFEDKEPFTHRPIFTRENPPPPWYTFRIGLDWGYADPYAYVLCAIDENGRKHILQSHEQTRLDNDEQAAQLKQACLDWSIPLDKVHIIADGSMWASKTINGVKFPPDIEAFQKAGFRCVPAETSAEAAKWRNQGIRKEIKAAAAGTGRGMVVYKGFNLRLIEAILGAKHDPSPGKHEQILHDENSHLCVALGNAVSSYDTPAAEQPEGTKSPEEQYEATNKAIKEAQLEERNRKAGLKKVVNPDGSVRWVAAGTKSNRPLGY